MGEVKCFIHSEVGPPPLFVSFCPSVYASITSNCWLMEHLLIMILCRQVLQIHTIYIFHFLMVMTLIKLGYF